MDQADRIRYAEQLRNNPLLSEILQECETSVIDAWKSAQSPEQREEKWYLLQAVEALRDTVYATLADIMKPDESPKVE